MRKILITNNNQDTLIVKKFLLDNASLFFDYYIESDHIFEVEDSSYNDLLLKQHVYFKQFNHRIKYIDYEGNVLPSGYTALGTFKIYDEYIDKMESVITLLKKWFMYYDINVVPTESVNTYTFIIDNFDEGANKIDLKEFIEIMKDFGIQIFNNPETEFDKIFTYKKNNSIDKK